MQKKNKEFFRVLKKRTKEERKKILDSNQTRTTFLFSSKMTEVTEVEMVVLNFRQWKPMPKMPFAPDTFPDVLIQPGNIPAHRVVLASHFKRMEEKFMNQSDQITKEGFQLPGAPTQEVARIFVQAVYTSFENLDPEQLLSLIPIINGLTPRDSILMSWSLRLIRSLPSWKSSQIKTLWLRFFHFIHEFSDLTPFEFSLYKCFLQRYGGAIFNDEEKEDRWLIFPLILPLPMGAEIFWDPRFSSQEKEEGKTVPTFGYSVAFSEREISSVSEIYFYGLYGRANFAQFLPGVDLQFDLYPYGPSSVDHDTPLLVVNFRLSNLMKSLPPGEFWLKCCCPLIFPSYHPLFHHGRQMKESDHPVDQTKGFRVYSANVSMPSEVHLNFQVHHRGTLEEGVWSLTYYPFSLTHSS